MSRRIFVFGSNLAGAHGKGSAYRALKRHGAILGQGGGLQGDSYAIPTKDKRLRVLSLDDINHSVVEFLDFALCHPEMEFDVVAIGCGLAGYSPKDIAPMFDLPPPRNVHLPKSFLKVIA